MSEPVTPPRAGKKVREGLPDWGEAFILALTLKASVACAATRAGVTRMQAYRAKTEWPDFSELWDQTLEAWFDQVESTTILMAVNGQVEPVVNKSGDVIGERVTRYPRINEFLLSSRRRETYGKTETVKHEIKGKVSRLIIETEEEKEE